jgi:hypothetical protein
MPDSNTPATPLTPPPPARPAVKKPEAEPDRAHMPWTEEFDKPKWTLPPWQPVAVALVIVAVIAAIIAYGTRSRPPASGSIGDVVAVTVPPGDNVLVAINVNLRNTTEKPLWIHTLRATVKTAKGDFSDDAANAVDFDRYYQGFPDLKQHALEPLKTEAKIPPGSEASGTMIFNFPVTKEEFDQRQSLTVIVQPYDRPAVVLKK